MDLAAVHQGLEDLLNEIPAVRCFGSVPDTVPVGTPDIIVVIPSDPYMEYSIPGAPAKHWMYVTLRVVPHPNSIRSVYQSLYELLSTGTASPRSIRQKLAGSSIGRTANSTACQAWVETARTITTQVNGEDMVGAELTLKIMGTD